MKERSEDIPMRSFSLNSGYCSTIFIPGSTIGAIGLTRNGQPIIRYTRCTLALFPKRTVFNRRSLLSPPATRR